MKLRRCFVALNLVQSLFYFDSLVGMDPDLRQGDGVWVGFGGSRPPQKAH
ncbi:hypothetical protein [Pseudoalteromonas sp. MSK9-3]|nr:hypothetical protein [Pseudoalteromonas sp. MSK9-3]